ncbi:MAG TPA: hypothetical protein VFY61_20545 [Pyrinomonadaceae bacterium]|nr:hypothetical protein [Pyrinomonadaceae bacterium]
MLLLQSAHVHAQQANEDEQPALEKEVAAGGEDVPSRLVIKNWELNRAYSDVFKILSRPNTCSNFYGGPRAATTVLNDFLPKVKPRRLVREVSFQMSGKPRVIHNPEVKATYRLFDTAMVNSHGSFYQRRFEPFRKFPSDVGDFMPGTRQARALILLHELGHLIQGENGTWLIPDDGRDGSQSNRNTLRVQEACRAQLEALKN